MNCAYVQMQMDWELKGERNRERESGWLNEKNFTKDGGMKSGTKLSILRNVSLK